MKTYYIYLHRNKINNKVYIGQTCQKPEYRWNNGKGYIQCQYFYSAIQKYGWDNFEHIILEEGLTAEQANIKEQEYIEYYNSTDSDYGYNIQKGGNNHQFNDIGKQRCSEHSKHMWTDEHKQKMSIIMKEKWQDENYIKKQQQYHNSHKHTISEQGKKNISEARKKYIELNGAPMEGKNHTETAKQKIRDSKIGTNNPMYGKTTSDLQKQKAKEVNSKRIKCLETEEIFNSIKEAAEWCGLKSASGISDYLNGKKKSAGKHPLTKEKLHWILIN